MGTRYGVLKFRFKKDAQQNLTNFYSDSQSVLAIVPDDIASAESALSVIKFLGRRFRGEKRIVVAATETASYLSEKTRAQIVRFDENDLNFLYLPKKSFMSRFTGKDFDLVIDLNFGFVPFAAYLTGMVESSYRVGFAKTNGDLFYNVQYRSAGGDNKELLYNSLCDFLGKF